MSSLEHLKKIAASIHQFTDADLESMLGPNYARKLMQRIYVTPNSQFDGNPYIYGDEGDALTLNPAAFTQKYSGYNYRIPGTNTGWVITPNWTGDLTGVNNIGGDGSAQYQGTGKNKFLGGGTGKYISDWKDYMSDDFGLDDLAFGALGGAVLGTGLSGLFNSTTSMGAGQGFSGGSLGFTGGSGLGFNGGGFSLFSPAELSGMGAGAFNTATNFSNYGGLADYLNTQGSSLSSLFENPTDYFKGLDDFMTNSADIINSPSASLDTASSMNVPGMNTSLPEITEPTITDPDSYTTMLDSGDAMFKPPTNSGIGIENMPEYSWQNKNFFGNSTGTGIEAGPSPEISNLDLVNAGPQNTTGYSFTQPKGFEEQMSSLYKGFNNSTAGDLYNKYKLVKGLGGLYDAYNQKKNMAQYQDMADPYAADRALASNKWQEITRNPEAAWAQYIGGQGKDFLNNAAAKYAAAGRRNMLPTLMNQMHQQYLSNYVPAYQKSVNPAQFPVNSGAINSLMNANSNYMGTLGNVAENLITNKTLQNTLSDIYDWF